MPQPEPEPVLEPEPDEPEQVPTPKPEPAPEPEPITVPAATFITDDAKPLQIALRTNLLFDLAGAPNLGVEVPIGEKFSVAVDGAYTHWHINNRYALQTFQGGVEGRYWFGQNERPLTGWNVGVYGMFGSRYDVQWSSGWQGDSFWSAGIGTGYSMPIGERLNLEFGIAAGYFFTPEVRHYHLEDNMLIWQETRSNVGRISLTKLKVNLIWMLGKKRPVR